MSQRRSGPAAPAARADWTIAALCTGTTLSAVNSGMVAVALVTLQREFSVDVATVTWVITAFYLTSAVLQPVMGRIADRYGPRRVFTIGLAIVAVAGALGPFAPAFGWVVAVRVLLAVGTSTTFPSAAAMLRSIAATSTLSAPKMIARIQLVDTSSAAVGPVLGGLLITAFGWEAIFWVNVPLAALAILATRVLAPRDAAREHVPLRRTVAESDLPGIILFAATVVTLLLFLLDIATDPNWWFLVAAIIAGSLFAWRELTCTTPFMDLRLLGDNLPLIRVYVTFILANLVLYSALFGVPQYLENHGGYRTDAVGALMLPLAAFTVILAPVVERMIDRRGIRTALVAGSIGLAASALALQLLAGSTSPWIVLLLMAAVGVPYGVVLISITQSLYVAAPPDRVGQAAGLFQTARSLGSIGSTVVVGLSFAGGTDPTDWTLLATVIAVLAGLFLAAVVLWRDKRAAPAGPE
ncbi:MFS transporter [Agromyces laixinhei]|uniref:MFS transporter n=1 Tax=Agromyces laixinhei TaxID=2585717 RepID=UPI0012EDE36C|nr:MFS transporter [Agromyces laixinhei]